METERAKGRNEAKTDVQGLAPALEESRKRNNRTVIEVNTNAVLVLWWVDRRATSWSARLEWDDVGRALWPLDACYYKVVVRRPGPGVGT